MDVPKDQIAILLDHGLYSSAQMLGYFLVSSPAANAETSPHLKAESLVLLGDALFREREYRRAIHTYKQALQYYKIIPKQISATSRSSLPSNSLWMWNLITYTSQMEGIPGKARNLQMHLLMGKLYRNSRHIRPAIACYKECLRHCPFILEAITALAELGATVKDIISLFPQTPNRSGRASFDHFDSSRWLQGLWKLKIHERLKLFLWKIASNIVPTKVRIVDQCGFILEDQVLCRLCHSAPETTHHLFLQCDFSQIIWRMSPWPMDILQLGDMSMEDWIKLIFNPLLCGVPVDECHYFQLFASNALDLIWFNRNLAAHRKLCKDPLALAEQVVWVSRQHWEAWKVKQKELPLQLPAFMQGLLFSFFKREVNDCPYVQRYVEAQCCIASNDYKGGLELFADLLLRFPCNIHLLLEIAKARVIDPYVVTYMDEYAMLLKIKSDYSKLNKLAHDLLNIDPTRPEVFVTLSVLWERKDERGALSYADKSIRIDERHIPGYIMKSSEGFLSSFQGNLLLTAKRAEAAVIAFRGAQELRPDIRSYQGLVHSYLALSKTKEALYAAREAMKAMPQSAKALKLVGDVHASSSSGREKAKKFYESALRLEPGYLGAALALAELHVIEGRNGDAVSLLERYLKDWADDSLHVKLAQVFAATNMLQDALSHYQAALRINPQNEAAKKGLERLEKQMKGVDPDAPEDEENEVEDADGDQEEPDLL
ncbi:Anaphase-promoting complex subunit 7 [Morella rubra]|uniref:Anaphase-promoting complex subunit 7 n=1 Tax=Morella rubra TaxID=262757 RepID=A0A6A1VQ38_9ROSI|nr:Anaphase-promoting complex subunit 7 [Morella rubra]